MKYRFESRNIYIALMFAVVLINGACQPRIPAISRFFMLGIRGQELTSDLKTFLGYSDKIYGVVVQDVIPSLVAESRGFQKGDVIERVNGEPVTGEADLIRKVNKGNPVIVIDCVRRIPGGEKLYIVQVPLENAPPAPGDYKTKIKLDRRQDEKLMRFIYDLFIATDKTAAI